MKKIYTLALLLAAYAMHAQPTQLFIGLHGTNILAAQAHLATVAPATGTVSNMFTTVPCKDPYRSPGFAIDTAHGIYYFQCNVNSPRLVGVSIQTGAVVVDTPVTGLTFGAMTFNHKDGKLYGWGGTGAPTYNTMLVSMEPGTGVSKAVSGLLLNQGGTYLGNAQAINEAAQLYYCITVNTYNYYLLAVNLYDGTEQYSHKLLLPTQHSVYGMAFDRWAQRLYVLVLDLSVTPSEFKIAEVDTATGGLTNITGALPGINSFSGQCIDPKNRIYYTTRDTALISINLGTGAVSSKKLSPDQYFYNYYVMYKAAVSVPEATALRPSVSPNPAHGSVTVSLATQQPYSIAITDALGRVVYTAAQLQGTQHIDITALPKGMYLLHTQTKDNDYTDKLVVE